MDAGALALVLCEAHSCWALIARHAVHHKAWDFDAVLAAVRATPPGWADAVRHALADEYRSRVWTHASTGVERGPAAPVSSMNPRRASRVDLQLSPRPRMS